MARRRMRRVASSAIGALVAGAVAGCGATIPADPDGTLEHVSGGVLEVGITPNPPHTDTSGEQPAGTEVALVDGFADSLDADVAWTEGSEEQLVRLLEIGELHLVVGGFSEQTPWRDRAAVTRPYAEARLADGSTAGLVMLAPMGENALLAALEAHLDDETEPAP